jgi:hypothetical protein
MRFHSKWALGLGLLISLTSEVTRAEGPQAGTAQADLPTARDMCQAALHSQDPSKGREICQHAYMLGSSPEDMRNLAASLVTGPKPPTMDDLALVFLLVQTAIHVAPKEPWGYVAQAEVAQRLGDPTLLEAALKHVRQLAPARAATLGAAVKRRQAAVWGGRLFLGLMILGTAVHAFLRSRRAARPGVVPVLPIALLALLVSGVARAEDSPLPTFPIDDQNPALSVPAHDGQFKDPVKFGYYLQELLARAGAASKKGDHQEAARFYTAICKAVPQRAYGFARLCDELIALDRKDSARAACREALYKEGVTAGDYLRYVNLMVNRPEPLTADERKDLDGIVAHLQSLPDAKVLAEQARCQILLGARDRAGMLSCAQSLEALAPNDPATLPFVWAAAMERGDLLGARALVAKMQAAGVAEPALGRMTQATRGLMMRRITHIAIAVCAAVVLLFLARAVLRKKRPPADPVVAA